MILVSSPPNRYPPRPEVSDTRLAREGLFYLLGMLATAALFFMPVFPSFMLVDWLDSDPTPAQRDIPIALQLLKYFALAFPGTAVLIIGTILSSALLRWTLMPRLQAGSLADPQPGLLQPLAGQPDSVIPA